MTISHALDVLRKEQLVETYAGRGVFITDHSAAANASREDMAHDAAIRTLRGDLDRLAERVARIERLITNGSSEKLQAPP